MSTFPGAIPSYSTMDPNQTLSQAGHTARHNEVQADVSALATKLGTGASVPVANTVLRGGAAGASAFGQVDLTTDVVNNLPINKGGTGGATANEARSGLSLYSTSEIDSAIAAAVLATKQALYPIGSIYTNASVNTNPGTLLGFGTWVAFGEGRVMVGVDSTQTEFDTLGETGGAKTHTLSIAEMPDHSVTISHHGDEGGSVIRQFSGNNGYTTGTTIASYRPPNAAIGGASSYAAVTAGWGSNAAHNNLQPYITVYSWKRTA